MGRKIPEPIRRKVYIEWLEGHPRQRIARDNQIGTGTVSEIINGIKEKDSETRIDVARMLGKEGLNMDSLLESIRLKHFLDQLGLKEEKLEDFARHLDIQCFKRGLTPDTFMDLVANISSLSDRFGVPIEELPGIINTSKEVMHIIDHQIKSLIIKKKWAIRDYDTTMVDLEEYRSNRPLIETLTEKEMELEKAKKQIFDLKAELFKWQYTNIANILDRPPPSAYTPIATPNLTQPTQPASLLGLLEGVNRGVAPNITGPSPAGPTNETPTQTNKTLPNPYTSTTTTTQPTNTLPFNNSNPNPPPPTQQNSTTAITLPAPPSASSPTPNSITSSGRRTSENNGTPTPSTPSNQQTITRGCGQGTANSRCRSPPTQQDTTTNLALPQTTSGLNLYEYGHVEAGKVGQHSIYEMFTAPPISKRLQDT